MSTRPSLSISVRRHFVDKFFCSHQELYRQGVAVADIGGRRHGKRGTFDIASYPCTVTYVNIEKSNEPDVLADAAAVPLPDASFDIVIMGELLEHVPVPARVIAEAHRLLKPGGTLLATVPFLYPVHGDPGDFGRYTAQSLRAMLTEAGFSEPAVAAQGSWYAVLALALQAYVRFPERSRLARRAGKMLNPLLRFLLSRDRRAGPAAQAWTTGFGIVAKKS